MTSSGESKYLKDTGLPGQSYGAAVAQPSKTKITPVMDAADDHDVSMHSMHGSTGTIYREFNSRQSCSKITICF